MPANTTNDSGAFVGGWLFHHDQCSVCHDRTTILRFCLAGPPPAPPLRLCRECLPIHRIGRSTVATLREWLRVRRLFHRATCELASIAAREAVQAAADAVQDAKLARLLKPVEDRLANNKLNS